MAGRGMIFVVGVEHFFGQNPEGRWVGEIVVNVENGGGIAEVGDRELVKISIQTIG